MANELNSLCLSCGMCCDGTIYLRAALNDDELVRLSPLGFDHVELDERHYFNLPCPQLSGKSCTIYATRPEVCGRYHCDILKAAKAGEMSIGEAKGHIGTALALRSKVEASVPGAGISKARVARRSHYAEQVTGGVATERAAAAARLLPMVAFDEYLNRWFRADMDQEPVRDGKA